MDSSTSAEVPSFDDALLDSSLLKTSSLYREEIRAFRKIIRRSETNIDLEEWKEFRITSLTKEEMESQIVATKIEGILDRSVEQIMITGCWPLFLKNNSKILKMYLQSKDVDVVMEGLAQLQPKLLGNVKSFDAKLAEHINPAEIIGILMQNSSLLNFAKENKPKIDGVALDLIAALELFKKHSSIELQKPAEAKIENQQKIKASHEARQYRNSALKLLQEQFAKQEEEYKSKIDALTELISEYKDKVEDKQIQIKLHIKKLVFTSETEMKMLSELGEANNAKLEEAVGISQQKYEDLLKANLENEKVIREGRRRTEASLQRLIQRYDGEALAKQAQIDELEAEMQNSQMQLDEWECLIFEQARVYKSYQREKENERLVELAKKLNDFQRNRAAIIIQRTWREYKAKKAAKKKARKDKRKAKGKAK